MFLIGIYTGLRLGDCCRLDWSNINLSQGVIQLIPQKTKRHAHGRPVTIPIHPVLGEALLGLNAAATGPVLPEICEMYTKSRAKVSDELGKIFKAANITMSIKIEGRKHKTPEATFHSLRHTFVSFAANAGIPLHFVQSIVGHESAAMTRHYYHEDVAGLRRAVEAIPSLVPSPVGGFIEPAQPAAKAPAPVPSDASVSARLAVLDDLKSRALVTPEEYAAIRSRILSSL